METDPKLEAWDRADKEQDTTRKVVVKESHVTMVVEAITKMLVARISTIVTMAHRNRGSEEIGTKVEAIIAIDRKEEIDKEATQSHLPVEAIKIEGTDKVAIGKSMRIKEATEVVVDLQRSQTHLS